MQDNILGFDQIILNMSLSKKGNRKEKKLDELLNHFYFGDNFKQFSCILIRSWLD